jgi:hypothetical protein
MRRKTFDNRVIDYSELTQQHLSNIIWFEIIIHNRDADKDAWFELVSRFDNEVLPYRPDPNFIQEFDYLMGMGFLEKKLNGEYNIKYKGVIVGEIM